MADARDQIINFFISDFKDWLVRFRWWFEYATHFYVGIHNRRIVLLFPDFHWFRAISFPFLSFDGSAAYFCYRWLPFKLLQEADTDCRDLFFPASSFLIEKIVDFISKHPVAEVDYQALRIFFLRIKSNAGLCPDLQIWDKDQILLNLERNKLTAYFLSKSNKIQSVALDLKSNYSCRFYLDLRLIKLAIHRLMDIKPLLLDKKSRKLKRLSFIFAENFFILSLPPVYIGFDLYFRKATPLAFSCKTNSPFLLPIDHH